MGWRRRAAASRQGLGRRLCRGSDGGSSRGSGRRRSGHVRTSLPKLGLRIAGDSSNKDLRNADADEVMARMRMNLMLTMRETTMITLWRKLATIIFMETRTTTMQLTEELRDAASRRGMGAPTGSSRRMILTC